MNGEIAAKWFLKILFFIIGCGLGVLVYRNYYQKKRKNNKKN